MQGAALPHSIWLRYARLYAKAVWTPNFENTGRYRGPANRRWMKQSDFGAKPRLFVNEETPEARRRRLGELSNIVMTPTRAFESFAFLTSPVFAGYDP